MAMTTSNSIRVKAPRPLFFIRFKADSLSPLKYVLFMRIQFLTRLLPPCFMAAAIKALSSRFSIESSAGRNGGFDLYHPALT
jgi:hypothetical protein